MSAPAGTTLPPQLTLRAVGLAIVLAMILAAANTYLGLFAGMTIASAIPAAVVSMAVLRVLGGGGMLENNIVLNKVFGCGIGYPVRTNDGKTVVSSALDKSKQ